MAEPPEPVLFQGHPVSAATPSLGESTDVECPICYQEYNQSSKCPRMLECLHVFCTECLQRIQLSPYPTDPSDPQSPPSPAISCPLCRHPTTLETGDPLTLPCNSRILAQLPPMAFRMPTSVATRLATVTQSVVLSLEASRDSRFIILPTVSLRVEQMHPSDRPHSGGGGLVDEVEVLQHHRRTLVCVQLLAVVFWVLFGVTCIVAVVFGPSFFCK
ncbi:RING finger domain-containing protein [Oncorhynchus tshawytscha]|uniref:RING finger domain-containing protein n=1 Tax=Oncorhynchus tshawytscha TaxID=74940 RepID=UPI000D09BC56|nr:RING finger domain-containing protein [Oncorhynchus tshawytscha]XP_024255730.1 RING finger domain-containing protein [Oncorhynchus tshawytscha]XP_031687230.1 E3 ubiquitin-protein ligase rnf152-B-like [Oncorhynchus kisutch]